MQHELGSVPLVIIPGHSTFHADVHESWPPSTNDLYKGQADGGPWVQLSYQGPDEPAKWMEHIDAGVILANQIGGIAVASGAATREAAFGTRWCEGDAYRVAAQQAFEAHVIAERRARHTLGNLVYGLDEYIERYGCLPPRVEMVNWKFKQDRVMRFWEALNLRDIEFRFHGVNQPDDLVGAQRGEDRVLRALDKDPFGRDAAMFEKISERSGQDGVFLDTRHLHADLMPVAMFANDPETFGRDFTWQRVNERVLAA